jgi:dissimilatory sulfite reductase (desulfoviridin) alpha/beta subunit
MKWTQDAEDAVKKVPFFVRKRVRARVEKEASAEGKKVVTLAEVKATQKRYLTSMKSEIKGYQIETCFGPGGCPNRAVIGDNLIEEIETIVKGEDLLGFIEQRVRGDLKFHHEFRITMADCPNACSQPQIKDIGIIGACLPGLTDETCALCDACVESCKEDAIQLDTVESRPVIDDIKCLYCGHCIKACPTGTITEGRKGYRVQLAGKLGRHPQLARELPGIFDEDQVKNIVRECLRFYKENSKRGQRFSQIFSADGFEAFAERYSGL